MRFETERLVLREYNISDFDDLYKILSDEETMKYYPHPYNKQETMDWINRNIMRYKNDGFGLFAVELKENGKFIGDCGLTKQKINGVILPELGYHINKDFQRRGFATEASAVCIEYAFEKLNFDRVYSYMKYTNEPSYKTALKNGMTFIEEYSDPVNTKTRVYSISADEWKEKTKKK